MSSSKKSPTNDLQKQYNHPFGHLFPKRINLQSDLEVKVFRAEETDKIWLREFLQWHKCMIELYSANDPMRKDLRSRFASEEQWKQEQEYYKTIAVQQFAVLKYFYQDRYEKYKEMAHVYHVGQEMIDVMERILRDDAEHVLIGEEDEHTES